MKTRHHYLLLVTSLLLIGNSVFAQKINDTTTLPAQFLFPHFTEGVMVMKDGKSFRGKLNYNTEIDQMQFLNPDNEILSIAYPEKVSSVSIGNRNFIYINKNFAEFLTTGTVSLCSRVHRTRFVDKIGAYGGVSPSSSITSMASVIGRDGHVSDLSLNEHITYKTDQVFYILLEGKMKMILNQRDLLKCFPSKKELIRQEIERQQTKFDNADSMKKIIEWIDANKIIE